MWDINFWIGFIGLLATLIFGILSIYLVKSKRYPGSITYIEEQSIGLFDSLVKNFPQISISYEGSDINEQIVLIKGYFLNTGNIDIKETMVEEQLKLTLPKNFKWLSSKVVGGTIGNKFSLSLKNNNELEINLGLFKKNEFLRFEALVEVPTNEDIDNDPSKQVSDNISFYHRIADTEKIQPKPFKLELPNFKSKKFFVKILLFFIGIIYFIIAVVFISKVKDDLQMAADLHYLIKTSIHDTIEVTATPRSDFTFRVRSIDKKKDTIIGASDFFNKFVIRCKISQIDKSLFWGLKPKYFIYLFGFTVMLLIFMTTKPLANQILEYQKTKRIRKILLIKD